MPLHSWPFRSGPENRFQTEELRHDLKVRLLEAVLWAFSRADLMNPEHCLRSESLRPYLFNDSRYDTVDDVVYARHSALVDSREIEDFALEAMPDVHKLMPRSLGVGRLLVWERDLTI